MAGGTARARRGAGRTWSARGRCQPMPDVPFRTIIELFASTPGADAADHPGGAGGRMACRPVSARLPSADCLRTLGQGASLSERWRARVVGWGWLAARAVQPMRAMTVIVSTVSDCTTYDAEIDSRKPYRPTVR